MTLQWLLPALIYMLAVGTLGITTKLALRDTTWPVVIFSTTLFYALICIVLLVRGGVQIPSGAGPLALVAVSGALTAGAFPLLVIALGHADASRVIPVTASYPIVTAVLAGLVLAEGFSWRQAIGTVLVVGGAVLVSTAR
jgi:transporter family protein